MSTAEYAPGGLHDAAPGAFVDCWGSRVQAALIDVVVLALIFGAFAAVSGGISTSGGTVGATLTGAALGLYFAVVFLYFWVFEWKMEATPGKRWSRVAVFAADGGEVGPARIAARNVLRFIDWLPFMYLVGFVSARVDGLEGRRLGDRVARTVVEEDVSLQAPWHMGAVLAFAAALVIGLGGAATGAGSGGPAPIDQVHLQQPPSPFAGWGGGNETLLEGAERAVATEGIRKIDYKQYAVTSETSVGLEIEGEVQPDAGPAADLNFSSVESMGGVRLVILGDIAWLAEDKVGAEPFLRWHAIATDELVQAGLLPITANQTEFLLVAGAHVVGPGEPEPTIFGETLQTTRFEAGRSFPLDGPVPVLEEQIGDLISPPPGTGYVGTAGVDHAGVLRRMRVSAECAPGVTSRIEFSLDPPTGTPAIVAPEQKYVVDAIHAAEARRLIGEYLYLEPPPHVPGLVATSCDSLTRGKDGSPSF